MEGEADRYQPDNAVVHCLPVDAILVERLVTVDGVHKMVVAVRNIHKGVLKVVRLGIESYIGEVIHDVVDEVILVAPFQQIGLVFRSDGWLQLAALVGRRALIEQCPRVGGIVVVEL